MIEVIQPGVMSSIQDKGRQGYLNIGVARAGAMDDIALKVGNILLENGEDAAAIELIMGGAQFRFHADCIIALTGADIDAEIDDIAIPTWWVQKIKAGQILNVKGLRANMYSYLCVRGGIDVPIVLASRSTDFKAGFGGYMGRMLKAGDRLNVCPVNHALIMGNAFGLNASKIGLRKQQTDGQINIRFIPANEWGEISNEMQNVFTETAWKITTDSNRMGYRLTGPSIKRTIDHELFSHGILPGTIQLPPSGQPVVQLNDANTCGGYPKLGVVIAADMHRLAQAGLGQKVHFQTVDVEGAQKAIDKQRIIFDVIARQVALARQYSCRQGS